MCPSYLDSQLSPECSVVAKMFWCLFYISLHQARSTTLWSNALLSPYSGQVPIPSLVWCPWGRCLAMTRHSDSSRQPWCRCGRHLTVTWAPCVVSTDTACVVWQIVTTRQRWEIPAPSPPLYWRWGRAVLWIRGESLSFRRASRPLVRKSSSLEFLPSQLL